MSESKRVLGFTVGISGGRSESVRKLEIRVREFFVHDASEELQQEIVRGNEVQQAYYLRKANAVQQVAGETRYFTHPSHECDLRFTWLADKDDPNQWFAGSVELYTANAECFSLLSKIVKSVGHGAEIGPRKLLEGLRTKMGVLPVQYLSPEFCFVRDQAFNLDAEIPAAELPSEPNAVAEVDPEAEELLENPEPAVEAA